MSESTNDRVATLVRGADREYRTTDVERARIRAAIVTRQESDSPTVLPVASTPRRSRRGRERVVMLVAALAMGVAGAIGWFQLRDDAVVTPATVPPPPATSAAMVGICGQQLAELDAAVEAWGEIGNWAVTRTGEPDLAALTRATFEALMTVGVESGEIAAGIDGVIDERANPPRPLGPEFSEHESIVREALVAVVFEVTQRDPSLVCPTSSIRSALGK